MKKTVKIALAGLALASLPVLPALAADNTGTGPYVKLEGGASFGRQFNLRADDMGQTIDRKAPNAAVIGAGVGWQVTPFLRTDLTLSYRFSQKWDGTDSVQRLSYSGDVSSLRGFANLYLDIAGLTDGLGVFKPYVGAGLGFARNKLDDVSVTDDTAPAALRNYTLDGARKSSFAWQVMAGTGIAVTEALIVDVGYRYVDAGDVKSGNTLTGRLGTVAVNQRTADLRTHEVTLGLRYAF